MHHRTAPPLIFSALVCAILLSACEPRQTAVQASKPSETKWLPPFSRDSGFLTKKQGLNMLQFFALADTSNTSWSTIMDKDTIGKYYKIRESGNYLCCVLDVGQEGEFETHLLLEIKPNGTPIKTERFLHGNYPCCWGNHYEGFNRHGDYFSLKTCGTGSGYCASYLYLFKTLKPQEEQSPIIEYYWSGMNADELSHSLSSTMEVQPDQVIMHYQLKKGAMDEDFKKFKVKKTDKFDVKYIWRNDFWVATDSTWLKTLDN